MPSAIPSKSGPRRRQRRAGITDCTRPCQDNQHTPVALLAIMQSTDTVLRHSLYLTPRARAKRAEDNVTGCTRPCQDNHHTFVSLLWLVARVARTSLRRLPFTGAWKKSTRKETSLAAPDPVRITSTRSCHQLAEWLHNRDFCGSKRHSRTCKAASRPARHAYVLAPARHTEQQRSVIARGVPAVSCSGQFALVACRLFFAQVVCSFMACSTTCFLGTVFMTAALGWKLVATWAAHGHPTGTTAPCPIAASSATPPASSEAELGLLQNGRPWQEPRTAMYVSGLARGRVRGVARSLHDLVFFVHAWCLRRIRWFSGRNRRWWGWELRPIQARYPWEATADLVVSFVFWNCASFWEQPTVSGCKASPSRKNV